MTSWPDLWVQSRKGCWRGASGTSSSWSKQQKPVPASTWAQSQYLRGILSWILGSIWILFNSTQMLYQSWYRGQSTIYMSIQRQSALAWHPAKSTCSIDIPSLERWVNSYHFNKLVGFWRKGQYPWITILYFGEISDWTQTIYILVGKIVVRRKLLHKYSEETLLPTDNTKEESCEDGWSGRIHPDTGDCDGPTCPIYSLLRQLLGSLHVAPGHHLSTLATNTYSPLTSLCSKSSNRWILKIFKLGRLSLWYNWNRWWLSADLHIEPLVHISILYCLCVYLIDIVYLLFHTWDWAPWAVRSEWAVQARVSQLAACPH